jgi:hypothetical protein
LLGGLIHYRFEEKTIQNIYSPQLWFI